MFAKFTTATQGTFKITLGLSCSWLSTKYILTWTEDWWPFSFTVNIINTEMVLTQKVINIIWHNSIVRIKCFLSLDPIMWKKQCRAVTAQVQLCTLDFLSFDTDEVGFYNIRDDWCCSRQKAGGSGWSDDLPALLFSDKVKWSDTKQVILVLHNKLIKKLKYPQHTSVNGVGLSREDADKRLSDVL